MADSAAGGPGGGPYTYHPVALCPTCHGTGLVSLSRRINMAGLTDHNQEPPTNNESAPPRPDGHLHHNVADEPVVTRPETRQQRNAADEPFRTRPNLDPNDRPRGAEPPRRSLYLVTDEDEVIGLPAHPPLSDVKRRKLLTEFQRTPVEEVNRSHSPERRVRQGSQDRGTSAARDPVRRGFYEPQFDGVRNNAGTIDAPPVRLYARERREDPAGEELANARQFGIARRHAPPPYAPPPQQYAPYSAALRRQGAPYNAGAFPARPRAPDNASAERYSGGGYRHFFSVPRPRAPPVEEYAPAERRYSPPRPRVPPGFEGRFPAAPRFAAQPPRYPSTLDRHRPSPLVLPQSPATSTHSPPHQPAERRPSQDRILSSPRRPSNEPPPPPPPQKPAQRPPPQGRVLSPPRRPSNEPVAERRPFLTQFFTPLTSPEYEPSESRRQAVGDRSRCSSSSDQYEPEEFSARHSASGRAEESRATSSPGYTPADPGSDSSVDQRTPVEVSPGEDGERSHSSAARYPLGTPSSPEDYGDDDCFTPVH